ncbi:MAG: hypothetical protein GY816_00665, partial [Cytophagales bacterium]|nr:hypothetical protein [Cytophagales bacterium]
MYDSLDKDLVMESLNEAMDEHRPDWSVDFRKWLLELVQISLESSMGVFRDVWYKQKGGIPTGGSLCVQLANIAVFSAMRKCVYNDPILMENIVSAKRYIDDGAGLWTGSKSEFESWIKVVNNKIKRYGLNIDEFSFAPPDTFIAFLDIQFCFNASSGDLET